MADNDTALYTAEQVEEVKQFLKLDKNDYYAILSVAKTADADEIKRAYKKQALRFHPDKNQAPGADEAFKAVGTAFACLSSEERRRQYDMFGVRSGSGPSTSAGHSQFRFPQGQHFHFNTGNGEIPMEDLFNMFFNAFADERFMQAQNGGFYFSTASSFPQFPQFPNFAANVRQRRRPQTHFQEEMDRRQRQRRYEDDDEAAWLIRLVQLLPLFFIVFLSFLSNLLFPGPKD